MPWDLQWPRGRAHRLLTDCHTIAHIVCHVPSGAGRGPARGHTRYLETAADITKDFAKKSPSYPSF